MITRCYSIFDRKTLVYFTPFFAATDGAAVRTLSDAMSDTNSMIGRHPADYVLFYVGGYDDAKGLMMPVSPLVHVMDAIALVQAMQHEIPFPEGVTSSANGEAKEA